MAADSDFTCEYFDGDAQAPIPVTEKAKKLFPDKTTHMNILLKMYKQCFEISMDKAIWERTENEVVDDVMNARISMNMSKDIEEEYKKVIVSDIAKKLYHKAVMQIPAFFHYAFIYYVWCYDMGAPAFSMPKSQLKLNLIVEALAAPRDELYNLFESVMTNPIYMDIAASPETFTIRNQQPKQEVIPPLGTIAKKILDLLLRKTPGHSNHSDHSDAAPASIQEPNTDMSVIYAPGYKQTVTLTPISRMQWVSGSGPSHTVTREMPPMFVRMYGSNEDTEDTEDKKETNDTNK